MVVLVSYECGPEIDCNTMRPHSPTHLYLALRTTQHPSNTTHQALYDVFVRAWRRRCLRLGRGRLIQAPQRGLPPGLPVEGSDLNSGHWMAVVDFRQVLLYSLTLDLPKGGWDVAYGLEMLLTMLML